MGCRPCVRSCLADPCTLMPGWSVPQWHPAGRCHPSVRPRPTRSCSRSLPSTCASTSTSSHAYTRPPTGSTPATTIHNPSGMLAARWVRAGMCPGWGVEEGHLRRPVNQGGALKTPGWHGTYPVCPCTASSMLGFQPQNSYRRVQTLLTCTGLSLPFSRPELPVGRADAAAEQGQVQCQRWLWLRAQTPVHVPG